MADVKVLVLKPFGTNKVGTTTSVPEDRIPFLLRKQLVEVAEGELSDEIQEKVDNAEMRQKLEGAMQRLATVFGIKPPTLPYELPDFLVDVANKVESLVSPPSSPQEDNGAAKTDTGFQAPEPGDKNFPDYLKDNGISNDTLLNLTQKGYDIPEAIIDADDASLDAVKGVGSETITKLRALATKFAG